MKRTTEVVPQVLFEDEALLVLNKPAGLVVHPAPSYHGPTLIDWLKEYLGPAAQVFDEPDRLGLVHRLDKDTSGVLLVTKNAAAKTAVGRQFHDRLVKKQYEAFIEGIPARKMGIISAPVGRSRKVPSRMAVTGTGRPSETSFEVAEKFKEVSLVNLYPKTGRTHQLRVHCAAIGHPIVGDRTYGSKAKWATEFGIERPLLHAQRIELEHPVTGERVQYEAPWPRDMKEALLKFRRATKAAAVLGALLGSLMTARADTSSTGSATKHKSTGTSSSSSSSSRTTSSTHTLRREVASLHDQFKSLIIEVSALQDSVKSLQQSMDELGAERRLRDLEKAISDLNEKAVGNANIGEETKTQAMELSRKVKEHQDALDQLRDHVDHLNQEVIQLKAHAEEAPPPPAPSTTGTGK